MTNHKLLVGDVRKGLDYMLKNKIFVDCVVTSPPYWALRNYNTPSQIWGGDKNCHHEFKLENKKDPMDRGGSGDHDSKNSITSFWQMTENKSGFCQCGAWFGELGQEPDPKLFIIHLCDVFDKVKLILKDTGSCWINISDTYYTKSGNNFKQSNGLCLLSRFCLKSR